MKSAEMRWSAAHRGQFQEHYETMRGYVRREVTRENLQLELGEFLKFPRRVLDVGGGDGSDARWLAGQNHNVVLVEPDRSALDEASKHLYPPLDNVLQGTSETALSHYGPGSFDLVLSHGVILYLDTPAAEIKRLSGLLQPGGYLSLLTAGKFGKINRFQAEGSTDALNTLLLTGKYTNNLGIFATAHLPREIDALLEREELETINWFGVRLTTDEDDRQFDEVPALHRNRILASEIHASRDPLKRPNGQMLHFIARKNT